MLKNIVSMMGSAPWKFSSDFSNGLDPRFQNVAGTWSIVDVGGGVMRLVNTLTTENGGLGADVVVNGGVDSGTDDWVAINSTIASVPNGQSGNCLEVTKVGIYPAAYQSITQVVNSWYRFSSYCKSGTMGDGNKFLGVLNNANTEWIYLLLYSSTSSWVQHVGVFRATELNSKFQATTEEGDPPAGTFLLDTISVKSLTLNTLPLTLRMASPHVLASVGVTQVAGLQGGLITNLDNPASPANFLVAYLDGAGNCKLDKCVAGVYTNVISGAVTYVAGTAVILDASALPTVVLKYGAATVGTGTISDAGIISNRYHGAFSTGSGYAETYLGSLSLVCS